MSIGGKRLTTDGRSLAPGGIWLFLKRPHGFLHFQRPTNEIKKVHVIHLETCKYNSGEAIAHSELLNSTDVEDIDTGLISNGTAGRNKEIMPRRIMAE